MFCGIPGSGKTTIANIVACGMGDTVHIQTDTIRSMLSDPKYSWDEARFVYESLFLVGREALKRGYDVILDGTFLKKDYRDEALDRLSRYCSASAVVAVVCANETAMARNKARNAVVPDESFDRLAKSFEVPEDGIVVRSDRVTPESSAGYVARRIAKVRGWNANFSS